MSRVKTFLGSPTGLIVCLVAASIGIYLLVFHLTHVQRQSRHHDPPSIGISSLGECESLQPIFYTDLRSSLEVRA